MKKYLEIAVGVMAATVAVSASAQSAASGTACSGTVAGSGSPVLGGSMFVQVTFTPRCSNNVFLNYGQGTVAFAVGGASSKGKNSFLGNTVGGGVSSFTSCAATGCDAGKASDAAAEALTRASSS